MLPIGRTVQKSVKRSVSPSYAQIPLDGHGPNHTGPDQTRPDTMLASRVSDQVSDQVSDMFGSG